MKPREAAYQPRLWEAAPANPHPLAALAVRQEAAAIAALGGPGRCACDQPGQYFVIGTTPAWLCRACHLQHLQEMREQCSMKR
jgi:hypothetical protein